MIGPAIIITNNKMVEEKLGERFQIIFVDGSIMDVLKLARDHIHKGHKLLTHPLAGSIKPNETPYKTVLISKDSGNTNDMDSLILMESCIHTAEKFLKMKSTPKWPDSVLDDFKLIDFDLINNAIN